MGMGGLGKGEGLGVMGIFGAQGRFVRAGRSEKWDAWEVRGMFGDEWGGLGCWGSGGRMGRFGVQRTGGVGILGAGGIWEDGKTGDDGGSLGAGVVGEGWGVLGCRGGLWVWGGREVEVFSGTGRYAGMGWFGGTEWFGRDTKFQDAGEVWGLRDVGGYRDRGDMGPFVVGCVGAMGRC